MISYLARRVVYMVLVLLLVTFIAFATIQPQAQDCLHSLSENQAISEEFGLKGSFVMRYLMWIKNLFKGNLGYSCPSGSTTVLQALFKGRWQWSMILAGSSFLLSWGLGILLGIYSAVHEGSIIDYLTRFLSVFSVGIPVFLLALLLVWLLFLSPAKNWGWGVGGMPVKLTGYLLRLIPAVLVVAFTQWAVLARHLRGHLLDVLDKPYIQVARAKGIPERRVTYRHAFRNALHPLLSLMGLWLPTLFESTIAVAIVMQLPVVELKLWDAIAHHDQYVILGGLLFLGVILMVGNLVADLTLAWADPRIRYE